MAVFDSPYNKHNIKPKVTEYPNGNISVVDDGIVIAFWNEVKGHGEISGQFFSTGYDKEVGGLHYKTRKGWTQSIYNRLGVMI